MIVIKIILYPILFIILLLLAVVIFALLSRIRFDILAGKNGTPRLKIKLSWLLTTLRFSYELNSDGGKLRLTLLWFDLTKSKKNKAVEITEPNVKESNQKPTETRIEINEKKTKPAEETSDEPEAASSKSSFIDNAKSAYEKYRGFVDYPDKDLIFEYTLTLITELLRAIGFKRFKLNATVGLDDPALTGMACALAYSVCGTAGLDISLEMDCENPTLAIDCQLYGRTSLWAFTWPLIKFALRKPIWKIIKKQLFRKDEKHEHRHKQQS